MDLTNLTPESAKKLRRIIIIVVAVTIALIVAFTVLYFSTRVITYIILALTVCGILNILNGMFLVKVGRKGIGKIVLIGGAAIVTVMLIALIVNIMSSN